LARIVPELSALEKALGKGDFQAQIQPLDAVVRALRQARVRSLQDVDLDTRGRLITTVSRVSRQTRPVAEPEAPGTSPGPTTVPDGAEQVASGAEEPASPTVPPEQAASEQGSAEESPPEEATADQGIGEGSPPDLAQAESAPEATPAVEAAVESAMARGAAQDVAAPMSPARAYTEVLFRVGLAWSAVGETERAESAYAAAGRHPSAKELRAPEPQPKPVEAAVPRGERRLGRGERRERGPKPEGSPRVERVPAGPRGGPLEIPPELAGDWKAQAEFLETRGRTRDAARLHDRHGSFADAARLFEAGGDLRSGLRAALATREMETARRLAEQLPPSEAQVVLEKAEAWELLMELHVRGGRFEEVAKLYERARQFDQAGLAWERAGKLSPARKAYERARDPASAERVRTLEVDRLVERGDRLGAALLLVQARRREDAAKLLEPLPPPKAFRFMHQLELHAEAKALGERELKRAVEEGKSMAQARWLELLERPADAAQAWEAAARKDKAFPLLEKAGQFGQAARLAEEFGNRNEAIRLFRRAGEDAEADRLEALPPVEAPVPLAEPEGDEEESSAEESGAPGQA
jgi:tetratricopeptide (TPR) repeat protein